MQNKFTRLEFRDGLGEGCANAIGIPGSGHPIRHFLQRLESFPDQDVLFLMR